MFDYIKANNQNAYIYSPTANKMHECEKWNEEKTIACEMWMQTFVHLYRLME